MSNRVQLTGSENQIDWAEDIRNGFQECVEWQQRCIENNERGSRGFFEMHLAGLVCGEVMRQSDSGWWIENRNRLRISDFKSRSNEIAKEILPEWVIKESMVVSKWTPKRGVWKRIYDQQFSVASPDQNTK